MLGSKFKVIGGYPGSNEMTISIERELYTEERILWMAERKPVQAPDQNVEKGVLDAIQAAI